MSQSKQFVQALQSGVPNVVYETLSKVILSDDQLDEKARVQKLVDLMHSFRQVKTEVTLELV